MGGACGQDRPLSLAETHLGPLLNLSPLPEERKVRQSCSPQALSVHFTDPSKPRSLSQRPSRGLGAGLKPGPLLPLVLELVRLGAHVPRSVHFSVYQLCRIAPHPAIRELGQPVQPTGTGWVVPKLGSCARNQGPAQMRRGGGVGAGSRESSWGLSEGTRCCYLIPAGQTSSWSPSWLGDSG